MVFQVSSNCRVFMFANALEQVSGCVPHIICIAQNTLKFVDYAFTKIGQTLTYFTDYIIKTRNTKQHTHLNTQAH